MLLVDIFHMGLVLVAREDRLLINVHSMYGQAESNTFSNRLSYKTIDHYGFKLSVVFVNLIGPSIKYILGLKSCQPLRLEEKIHCYIQNYP